MYYIADDCGRAIGRGLKKTKFFYFFELILLTILIFMVKLIQWWPCIDCTLVLGRFICSKNAKKLFDKLTVKPKSSESAAPAVNTRFRSELKNTVLLSTFGAYAV